MTKITPLKSHPILVRLDYHNRHASLAKRVLSNQFRSIATLSPLSYPHHSTSVQPTDLIQLHRGLVASCQLQTDLEQTRAVHQLNPIHKKLKTYAPHPRLMDLFDQALLSPQPENYLAHLDRFTMSSASGSNRYSFAQTSLVRLFRPAHQTADEHTPHGFLLIGPPGTGKTLLMDLFFDSLPTPHKFRQHYHHFLLSLYSLVSQRLAQRQVPIDRIHDIDSLAKQPSGYLPPRQDVLRNKALSHGWRSVFAGGVDPRDPVLNGPGFVLAQVARDLIIQKGYILAFDEIQMVDVAGAGIISRVLEWYWRLGGVVIGTSNRLPEHMYDQGVQKSTVLPFLDRLKTKSPSISLNSHTDWRLAGFPSGTGNDRLTSHWYHSHNLPDWRNLIDSHLSVLLPEDLLVYGRKLTVEHSNPSTRSALFTYSDLCEKALGPADFLTICSKFEKIFIQDLPVFTTLMKNEARRFITFIDACYECAVKLYVQSDVPIDSLFFPDNIQHEHESSDFQELETLRDLVEELEEPFRPNISTYGSSPSISSSRSSPATDSSDSFAIFTGQDEQYAFQRAVSRMHELTSEGGRKSKEWMPVELGLDGSKPVHLTAINCDPVHTPEIAANLRSDALKDNSDPLQSLQPSTASSLTCDHSGKDVQTRLKPPFISPVHIWGVIKWGERAGRWGKGVEAFQEKSNKK